MSYADADALVEVWRYEWGTELHAAVNGWAWPMTRAEVNAQYVAVVSLNANRDRDKHPEPIELTWPWPEHEPVDPELQAEMEARLASMSALGPEHDDV